MADRVIVEVLVPPSLPSATAVEVLEPPGEGMCWVLIEQDVANGRYVFEKRPVNNDADQDGA